jgi:hypothetical protein
VTVDAGGTEPIEVHLPDGGHVIVVIQDQMTRLSGDCDELVPTLLRADGTEQDVERAIREQAADLGIECTSSPNQHPTVILLRAEQRSGR